jgi:excinuclease ABC subunit B
MISPEADFAFEAIPWKFSLHIRKQPSESNFGGTGIERIVEIDPLTGEMLAHRDQVDIYPAKHFVTSHEKLLAAIEDIKVELQERLTELREPRESYWKPRGLRHGPTTTLKCFRRWDTAPGWKITPGISSGGRREVHPGLCWITFLMTFLLFIDESHMTLPQIRGMYHGDISRKQTLVDYGFRLPSALDNRPLRFEEFNKHINQVIYVSATPKPYEYEHSQQVVEQLVRPTGLLEPTVEVKPVKGQIDDLIIR